MTDYHWHTSCSPGWIQNNDTFEFNVKKGVVGECPGDDKPHRYGVFKFKERQEVRSDRLKSGIYKWSATVETISEQLNHASHFSLFQIHSGETKGRPPHGIQVKDGDIFIIRPRIDTFVGKYKGKLKIETNIRIKGKTVMVEYILDGTRVAELKSKGVGKPFIKFGIYRWNAVCDVKQIYSNVRLEKINVSRH